MLGFPAVSAAFGNVFTQELPMLRRAATRSMRIFPLCLTQGDVKSSGTGTPLGGFAPHPAQGGFSPEPNRITLDRSVDRNESFVLVLGLRARSASEGQPRDDPRGRFGLPVRGGGGISGRSPG